MSTKSTPPASDRALALAPFRSRSISTPPEVEVVPHSEPIPVWKRPEFQKLWLATQDEEWQSLALVPAGEMPAGFTLEIAVALVHTGSIHLGVPIRVADGTGLPLSQLKPFLNELEALKARGERVLMVLGPISESATQVPLARAADRALLCVPLEMAKTKDAQATISEIGAKHFLGSAAFQV